MKKKLYITEKPSVAESFAKVLGMKISKADRGRGYAENEKSVVTWCYGHLVTMAYPDAYDAKYKKWRVADLPIIPDRYKYVTIADEGNKKQFETIKELMCRDDLEMIYSCTDSGREGEYIFRLVYQLSGSDKPVRRVWISAQTEEAIDNGLKEAKDLAEYDNLAKAAYARAKEDWLFGMNFSRMYTCQYGWDLSYFLKEKRSSVIAVGRVMTCVLGLVVDRETEIKNFITRTHYGITAGFKSQTSGIAYEGKWIPEVKRKKEGEEPSFLEKEEAQKIIEELAGKKAIIKKVDIKPQKESPPLLFNLAALQMEAQKKYKISVDKTLEIAQALYEKKLISYPRTDSRVLASDVLPELPKILNGLYRNEAYADLVVQIKAKGKLAITAKTKRYVDDSKVTDHYAIIPTYQTKDLAQLDQGMRDVYDLIVKRFLAMFYPKAEFNTVKVITQVQTQYFTTNSKTLKIPGWKIIYQDESKKSKGHETEVPLYELLPEEDCQILSLEMEEKETKAPSRFTDGSLIITMEKAGKYIENEELREQLKSSGIGTSATRAGIIKKLCYLGYISVHKKNQIVTPTLKGTAIAEMIRLTAKELLNPALTASWEKGLFMIQNAETTEEIFNQKLETYIGKTIEKIKASRNIGRKKQLERILKEKSLL